MPFNETHTKDAQHVIAEKKCDMGSGHLQEQGCGEREGWGGWGYDVCRARQHRRGEEGSWGLLKIESRERWGCGGEWETAQSQMWVERESTRTSEGQETKVIHRLFFYSSLE